MQDWENFDLTRPTDEATIQAHIALRKDASRFTRDLITKLHNISKNHVYNSEKPIDESYKEAFQEWYTKSPADIHAEDARIEVAAAPPATTSGTKANTNLNENEGDKRSDDIRRSTF